MDIDSGDILWRHSMPTRPGAAAHDVANGDVLFHVRLPGSAQGFPITYAVDGRQYLAVPVGGDRSNAIYVFALPPDRP
jgi:alcohol dehydrogenase (cytochrome c)